MKKIVQISVLGFLVGCGASTKHVIKTEGEAVISHKFGVDTEMCEGLEGQERVECLEDLRIILKKALEKEQSSPSCEELEDQEEQESCEDEMEAVQDNQEE